MKIFATVSLFLMMSLSLAQEKDEQVDQLRDFMFEQTSTTIYKMYLDYIDAYNTKVSKHPQEILKQIKDFEKRERLLEMFADVKELPEIEIVDGKAYHKTKLARIYFTSLGLLKKELSINGKVYSFKDAQTLDQIAEVVYQALHPADDVPKTSWKQLILSQIIASAYARPQNQPRAEPYGPNSLYLDMRPPAGSTYVGAPNAYGLQRWNDSRNRNSADFEIMRLVMIQVVGADELGFNMDMADTSEQELEVVRGNLRQLATALTAKKNECQRDLQIMQRTGRQAGEFNSIKWLVKMLNWTLYTGVPDVDQREHYMFMNDVFMNTAPWCRENPTDYYAGHSLYLTFGNLWHRDVCRPFLELKACLETARFQDSTYEHHIYGDSWTKRDLLPMLPPRERNTRTIDN